MTILTLDKAWLLRVDTGETFGAQTNDRGQSYEVEGGVDNHAGGRQRAWSVEGESGSFSVTFLELSLAQVTMLRSWMGQEVYFRDHRGQSMFGVFFAVEPVERPEPKVYNAKITLSMVTDDVSI